MSFSFSGLLSFAKTVITDVAAGAEAIAPVASVIPGGAAIDSAVATAATVANGAVDAGLALLPSLSAEALQLEALFDSLFHVAATPGAIVLTPKTSSATASTTPAATRAATTAAS